MYKETQPTRTPMVGIIAVVMIATVLVGRPSSQGESLWIEDLTTNEVQAAMAAGKTTAIYYASGVHQNGEEVALGKHVFVARYLAQRIAEELGNALVLPVNPYAPAFPGGDPTKKTGHLRFAGSTSVTEETFGNFAREVVTSVIVAAGFKNVVLMGDHGYGNETLKKVAEALDADWKPQGTRVYYVPVYEESDVYMKDYLAKLNVPAERRAGVDNASEIMSIDADRKWVRQDKIGPDDRQIISPELGKVFLDFKASTAVRYIRSLTSNN